MMNLFYATLILTEILFSGSYTGPHEDSFSDKELIKASETLHEALKFMNEPGRSPRTYENKSIIYRPSRDWTSGFFPGMLWMMYDFTGDTSWKNKAHHFTMNLEKEQYNDRNHDIGFKIFCSFGKGYKLTDSKQYRAIIIQSAKTLITRYNPVVGCIRSWDHHQDKWDYPVIIDNMMNLELLFFASRETGDSVYYTVAKKHAETTMRNHFREDYSSYHVVSYDTLRGKVNKKNTHQGYAHESAWARGQAWGLYGFTMTYRETGETAFLEQAKGIADFIINHPNLPEDKIPYWDFNAPGQPDIPRDASAGSIIASALYELAGYSPMRRQEYLEVADQIVESLSSKSYQFNRDAKAPFLLDHSVGNHNRNSEVDVPIIYSDYYYLEALMRKKNSRTCANKLNP